MKPRPGYRGTVHLSLDPSKESAPRDHTDLIGELPPTRPFHLGRTGSRHPRHLHDSSSVCRPLCPGPTNLWQTLRTGTVPTSDSPPGWLSPTLSTGPTPYRERRSGARGTGPDGSLSVAQGHVHPRRHCDTRREGCVSHHVASVRQGGRSHRNYLFSPHCPCTLRKGVGPQVSRHPSVMIDTPQSQICSQTFGGDTGEEMRGRSSRRHVGTVQRRGVPIPNLPDGGFVFVTTISLRNLYRRLGGRG